MKTPEKTIVRFAPSPTGRIHIGNARTALINALVAIRDDGELLLRFDDTDKQRSTTEFAEAIADDLAWLGIQPARTVSQSPRFEIYNGAADRLRDRGLLYPCYETPDELERRRKRQMARGMPPVYDRAALTLTDAQRRDLEGEGRHPHWRFLLPNFDQQPGQMRKTEITWTDGCRGRQSVDIGSLSDPVLIRADGSYLYTLPSVVDDLEWGVTQVIRGDDHVTNTAVQIVLAQALGGSAPDFAHHNLLTKTDGEGLSKRLGSLSIGALRDQGYEPMAVASLAVLIGTSLLVEPVADLRTLAAKFDLTCVSRSPAKFDQHELDGLNARLLHDLPFSAVADRLNDTCQGAGEAFWLAVRGNIDKFAEILGWWEIVNGPVNPQITETDAPFLTAAADALPGAPWTLDTWGEWTNGLKATSERKGKSLFMPLRLALTGIGHGPELKTLLPLIGPERAAARLRGER